MYLMKSTGTIIMVIGLVITLITGFKYVTKEKVVDIGPVEITQDKKHGVSWSPLIGVGIMVIGGVVFFLGSKKE